MKDNLPLVLFLAVVLSFVGAIASYNMGRSHAIENVVFSCFSEGNFSVNYRDNSVGFVCSKAP